MIADIENAIRSVAYSDVLFDRTKNAPKITINELSSFIFKRVGIEIRNTKTVLAHLISQLAHETDGFRAIEEYRNKDGSTPKYWYNYDGGSHAHGRGLMHLTHAKNYEKYFKYRGYKEVNYDLLVTDIVHIVGSGMYYWKHGSAWGNINQYAGDDDPIMVTMAINGGFNGLKKRIKMLNKVKKALGLDMQNKYLLKNSRLNNSKKYHNRFIRVFGRYIEV
jgi:predicted chitinase